ncbi:hypothetical protein BDY19DRAFT_589490 [Irpex rosettiformis]|uniref:Uncharacterized protein n=1 Tax=Irpex rosettiformis TaxID=378272 RepID=A0ACB8UD24_9APHY|nr:hypothetical protein BDY19DRAFT_589490 [Irpex rosettiformis]
MAADLATQLGALRLSETMPRPLPMELYRDIFSYVSSMRDFCSLSVLCRNLQPEAEFFIYRSVQSTSRSQTEFLCDIISSSAHRHMLIRELDISHDEWKGSPISEARNREYWERVARLLHDLPNLQNLKIHDMAMQHGNPNAWVLSHATCSLIQFDSDFVFDDCLVTFLYNQRQMKRLYWTENYADDESRRALISSGATSIQDISPSVTLLNTNSPQFAIRCMRSAKLSHVWVCGPCAYEDDGWIRYMERFVEDRKTAGLVSLRLNLPYRKRTLATILSAIAKTTPDLRSLGFLPFFTSTDTELIDVLSQFRQLRSIVTWNVIERNTSRIVSQACPSLRFIACLHYSYSHEYVVLPVNPLGTPRPLHDPQYLLWKNV